MGGLEVAGRCFWLENGEAKGNKKKKGTHRTFKPGCPPAEEAWKLCLGYSRGVGGPEGSKTCLTAGECVHGDEKIKTTSGSLHPRRLDRKNRVGTTIGGCDKTEVEEGHRGLPQHQLKP